MFDQEKWNREEPARVERAEALLRLAQAEEAAGRYVGLEKFLEERIGNSRKTQEWWREKNRWGYEMLGHLNWWLSRHPETSLLQRRRISYGFLESEYRLPDGTVVLITTSDHKTSFGRD